MKKSKNEEVQKFLNEIMMTDAKKSDVFIKMRQIIFDFFPETNERIMYGGIVFFLNNEMFSGLFVHKNHVTLEFSKGFLMKNPNSHLEGKGKYRRHLKILTTEDITSKQVSFYIKQAI